MAPTAPETPPRKYVQVRHLHVLWHTSATLLMAQGVNPKFAQERLGHADISITLNRYSDVTPDMQRSAADTLDSVFTRVS
jgi:site-specific recombinase XerD